MNETFINMDNINMYRHGKKLYRRTHRNARLGIKQNYKNFKSSINRMLRKGFI